MVVKAIAKTSLPLRSIDRWFAATRAIPSRRRSDPDRASGARCRPRCRYHLYVQIRKHQDGEAKNIILGAFGGHYDIKHVIVVDEDVNIHDATEVEWAIATRFQADRDLIVISEAQGPRLDPSSRNGVGAKMGFDATKPLDAPPMRFTRIRVPGEESVDLDAAIDAAAGGDWRARRRTRPRGACGPPCPPCRGGGGRGAPSGPS